LREFSNLYFTGCTSVNIGINANLELVDKLCYLGNMLSVDGDANAAVETKLDGINSGSWCHCLPISYIILPMKFLSFFSFFFLSPQDLRDGSTDREPF